MNTFLQEHKNEINLRDMTDKNDHSSPVLTKEYLERYTEVPMSKEEYSEWCKSWHGALVVRILGLKINFKIL